MGLLSPAFERRTSVAPTLLVGDPALSNYFGGNTTSSAQNVNSQTALAVSTVYACVNRKALTLAMIPLHTMRALPDGGHEVAKNHRTYRQLHEKPNDWQTSFEWRQMGQAHKMLRGNFYNYIQSTPGRGLNQLIPMHPDRVYPFIVTPQGVTYYMYDNSPPPPSGSRLFYQYFPVNGESVTLRADEVLHIKGLSDNGIVGKSVVKLMAESVGLALATEQQGATLFTNGTQIGKVFKHPAKLDDAAFDRLKRELDEHTGVANSHKTIILENGMDIAKISLTMEEAQFLETRKFQVEDICSFLDVPLMLIHRSGDKNQTFASAEVLLQMFVTMNMQPEFENWEQRMKVDLLYDSERDYYFSFDFNALMRGDMTAQASYNKSRFETGSWTPNDIRKNSGESPIDKPEANELYVQSGIVPARLAGQQNQPVKPDAKVKVKTKEPKGKDEVTP
jgi:HK97 family phage portal protein